MSKNYYQVLGLPDFADAEAVKAAFRKLARQHHPDLNAGNPAAEERFKEINEAYEVLSDADKRAKHDVWLRIVPATTKPGKGVDKKPEAPSKKSQPASSTPSPSDKAAKKEETRKPPPPPRHSEPVESFGERFESFLRKGFSEAAGWGDAPSPDEGVFRKKTEEKAHPHPEKPHEKPQRGEDVIVKTTITPMEASEGVVKTVQVQHHELCRRCSGTGRVNGASCMACDGEKVQTRTKKMDVRIPAGVKNGSRVRVAKEGGRGSGGAESGDLFLQIEIAVDSSLRIEGMDVHGELALSVTDAVLGADVEVPTLNGGVKMSIPAGTQTGRTFRLKERGVVSGLAKGDHFVTVTIVIPENLSHHERELYQELARLRPEKPVHRKK